MSRPPKASFVGFEIKRIIYIYADHDNDSDEHSNSCCSYVYSHHINSLDGRSNLGINRYTAQKKLSLSS